MSVYLVAAYAVFWALSFGLILSIWARQRRIEREIATLKAQLKEREETEAPT
jgi:heme exporter protein CcmD